MRVFNALEKLFLDGYIFISHLIKIYFFLPHVCLQTFNPKMARVGGGGGQIDPPPVVFQKLYLLERGWNPGFLWLNISSENFIEFPQVVQKSFKVFNFLGFFIYLFIYFYFYFFIFYFFFDIYLVTKNLMTSACNRWCQHFFTLNIL